MRTFFLILTFSLSLLSNAQTWNSIPKSRFGSPFPYMYAGNASVEVRYFQINPYDNSLWFSYNNKIQRVNGDGYYQVYDTSNTESLLFDSEIFDFAFTPHYSFVMDGKYGLHQFDENNWSLAIPFTEGESLAYDADTIWCIRNGENYIKWYDGFNSQSTIDQCNKAITKGGLFWGGAQSDAVFRIIEDQQLVLYSPDTCSLIDWGNYDFKFCKKTDSMYVSNTGGLAIADGKYFVDSICSSNSTNMPSGIILEFEFDANDNIWALFGNSNHYISSIAFLNTTTKTWSNFYDASNSPISFNNPRVSIEIDTIGNVWVIDMYKLNVLDFGNAPQWLGVKENDVPVYMNVYPNPAKNNVTVQCKEHGTIRLLNLQGEVLQQQTIQQTTQVSLEDLSNGTYLIELITEEGKAVKQVVKQ